MKQSIIDTNNQVISFALNESVIPYLNITSNIYDINKVLYTFPNVSKTTIKPFRAQRELISRVVSILNALRSVNLTVEEYLSVANDPIVEQMDLMYISSKEISNESSDEFIQSIKEVLEKNNNMEGGGQVEQNQGNEAKPRQ